MARILTKEEIEELLSKRFPKDWPKEWIEYAKEYDISPEDIWQVFLWGKNEKNEIIVNVSEQNIKKCQQLYDWNPEDEDNLLRLLPLKIFSGQECRDLTTKFLKLLEIVDFNFYIVVELVLNKCDAIEPYLPRLKNFFLWLMDISPERFRKAIMVDFEDGFPFLFQAIFKLVGSHMACQIMAAEQLYFLDIYLDAGYAGYMASYVTAESCYLEKRWFDAFILFRKLETFNEIYKLTNEVLYNDFKDGVQYFNDILHSPPTLEEIKNRSYECYCNLINSGEKAKLYDFFGMLEFQRHIYQQVYQEQISDPYVKGFIIIKELTLKLREFISKNLTKYYGDEVGAWQKGVILKIGHNSRFFKRFDVQKPEYDRLNYLDYKDIIYGHWEIFRDYFAIGDIKNEAELTAFFKGLKDFKDFRNKITHLSQDKPGKKEIERSNHLFEVFLKIYERWKSEV